MRLKSLCLGERLKKPTTFNEVLRIATLFQSLTYLHKILERV